MISILGWYWADVSLTIGKTMMSWSFYGPYYYTNTSTFVRIGPSRFGDRDRYVGGERLLTCSLVPFGIRLGMIRSHWDSLHSKDGAWVPKELCYILLAVICQILIWYTIEKVKVFQKTGSDEVCGSIFHWYCGCELRKSNHGGHNKVFLRIFIAQVYSNVYCY